jgi:putative transcriptional regulator
VLKNRVRELRARERWSQHDLADKIDVSRQTIALIERGDYSPSIVIALKMAKLFAVPIEQIFYLEDISHEHKTKVLD